MTSTGREEPPSPDGPAEEWKLPDRKAYLTSLSTVAFLSGLGIATAVAVRRGRAQKAAQDAVQAAGHEAATSSTVATATRMEGNTGVAARILPEGTLDSLKGATEKGPLALFREMNAAAFGLKKGSSTSSSTPSSSSSAQAPTPSALRRTSIQRSVFDAHAAAPPPSALVRAPAPSSSSPPSAAMKGKERAGAAPNGKGTSTNEELEKDGESPALVAIKALGIATALVGAGALLFAEVARRILGVKSTDELVERLHELLPESMRDKHGLAGVRRTLSATLGNVEEGRKEGQSSEDLPASYNEVEGEPLPLQEALDRMDEAASRGEAAEWAGVLNAQINAEVRQMVEERKKRLQQQQQQQQ